MPTNRSTDAKETSAWRLRTYVWALPAATLLIGLSGGCAVPQPRGGGKLERLVDPKSERGFWLYLPAEYVAADEFARRDRRWPVVVSFHGMKPFDNAQPQAREWEQEADRFGYIVVAPELRAPDVMAQFPVRSVDPLFKSDEMATLNILDYVFSRTQADSTNVLSTSWSSGGYLAHYMLNHHPERFTCLAVRQSNFSSDVLDEAMTARSRQCPILIVNTQNDFDVCKRESREAVAWYQNHGYANVAWVHIKDLGHQRTPDLAADFFGHIAGVTPNRPPTTLVQRQAIDGNAEGLALLFGRLGPIATEPQSRGPAIASATPPVRDRGTTPPRRTLPRAAPPQDQVVMRPILQSPTPTPQTPAPVAEPTPSRGVNPQAPTLARSPLSMRVSTAVGLAPLLVQYSAECPSDWLRSADFLWTLDGTPIGNGVNGQKTLLDPGTYQLGLLVVTSDGAEHRANWQIRVLPSVSASAGRHP
jgi:poly(3-hydroxybutyrate) depolymerase